MALPTKTTFTIDWTTFADVVTPGTYTATQLKALFNERDQELLDFINSILAVFISTTLGSSGAENIGSPTISGVSGNTPYAQIADLRAQILALVGGAIPAQTITTAMIQDLAVTFAKLAPTVKTGNRGGKLYQYRNSGGF